MTWPAVLFWVLIIAAAASDGPALLYLFFVIGAFGTLQMIPGGTIGSATFLPQSVCAAILVVKVLAKPGNVTRSIAIATDPRRLGLLAAFLAYSLATAVILPRLFAGRIELFSVSGDLTGTSLVQPSGGNATQSCYMTLSIATAIAFAILGTRPDFRRHVLIAVLLWGIGIVTTGMVDLTAYALGLGALLDPFRNVTYTLLTDVETLGAKRVVGLMSEASSFGCMCVACLGILCFLRPCFTPRLRNTVVPLTIAGLLVMAAVSTSSSAYVGLGVFAASFLANWSIRLISRDAPAREDLRSEMVVVILAAFALLCVVVISPASLAPSSALLDSTIFEKSSSASFIERGTWTAFGWRAFWETGGLGVGIGSLRVSNWLVSILGSTGLVGAVLMFGFIMRSLLLSARPRDAQDREWQRGLQFSLVAPLAMASLIGTMPDLGPFVAALFGLLVAATPLPGRGSFATRLRPRLS